MINIVPIKMLVANGMAEAVGISVISAYDNLTDKVIFEYLIYSSPTVTIGGGKIEISGEDYLAWDGSKESAYLIVAVKCGLEIKTETTKGDVL